MSKSPAEKLAKAERRAAKAQRVLAAQRRLVNQGGYPASAAVDPAVGIAARLTPGRGPSPLPVTPDPYDEHLLTKAMGAGGDEVARELLRRRGTDGVYASYARHILKTATDPGLRSHAAGVLAALDEDFDPYAPQPRAGAL